MTETFSRCVWPAGALLGEGPMWSARDNAVYWVDIKGQFLHRLSLADESKKSWPMPERIGRVVERSDQPGFVAGFKSGFVFHTDSALRRIYVFDLSDDGAISKKRVFLQFEAEQGYPDGMTVDAQEHLWVAHWGGSRVSRFQPDGSFDRAIKLPASQITSCVFAGDKLDRMFVTSAAIGLSKEQRASKPLAGSLFEVDPSCSGLPTRQFAG